MGSRTRGLSSCCLKPCGIFPNQGSNPCIACIGKRILNHWTTREVPVLLFLCTAQRHRPCFTSSEAFSPTDWEWGRSRSRKLRLKITGQTEIWVWIPALEEAHELAKPLPVKWCPRQRKSLDPTGPIVHLSVRSSAPLPV